MGMTPVRIDEGIEVRVKDNDYAPDGWHLWMSVWVDGEYVDGDTGPVVPDLDDDTLIQAARQWYADRGAGTP